MDSMTTESNIRKPVRPMLIYPGLTAFRKTLPAPHIRPDSNELYSVVMEQVKSR